jgi:hypothetical protein
MANQSQKTRSKSKSPSRRSTSRTYRLGQRRSTSNHKNDGVKSEHYLGSRRGDQKFNYNGEKSEHFLGPGPKKAHNVVKKGIVHSNKPTIPNKDPIVSSLSLHKPQPFPINDSNLRARGPYESWVLTQEELEENERRRRSMWGYDPYESQKRKY